jgi:putative glutamine amidotransferase
MGMLPIPLPNICPTKAPILIEELGLEGIILTGGNSLAYLDKSATDRAPERDRFEHALIEQCINKNIPLFGVCRGMQAINYYFSGRLTRVEGHIATRHDIFSSDESIELSETVNSFHGWTIPKDGLGTGLSAIALDVDKNIEGFLHENKRIAGIMWHPEREEKFNNYDKNLIRSILL